MLYEQYLYMLYILEFNSSQDLNLIEDLFLGVKISILGQDINVVNILCRRLRWANVMLQL